MHTPVATSAQKPACTGVHCPVRGSAQNPASTGVHCPVLGSAHEPEVSATPARLEVVVCFAQKPEASADSGQKEMEKKG
jgi:hypothetical protein